MPTKPTVPCNECQAGHMHQRYLTYFTWLSDEIVIVPDFPAWVCDVCGRREYDHEALKQLFLLLKPTSGKSAAHRRPAAPPSTGKSTRQSRL